MTLSRASGLLLVGALALGCNQSAPAVSADLGTDSEPVDSAAERPLPPDAGPLDVGGDIGGDAHSWPEGFVRTAPNTPSGLLCDIPPGYVEGGGDPVRPSCELELDHFSDQPPPATAPQTLKVVTWNIEYGQDSAGVLAALADNPDLADADVLLLQEVPRGDKSSKPPGNNLAREIARARRYDYVFAVEWDRRLDSKGGGEHGLAVLSKYAMGNAALIRHTPAHDFYGEKKHFGGRATLAVELALGPTRLRLYNAHLATRDIDGGERALQGKEIRLDAAKPQRPRHQLVGGDFNTFVCNPTLVKCYEPPWAEKVIRDLLADGWADLVPAYGGWTQLGIGLLPQRLDWLFGRWLKPTSHAVLKDVRPADHVPVVATVTLLTPALP